MKNMNAVVCLLLLLLIGCATKTVSPSAAAPLQASQVLNQLMTVPMDKKERVTVIRDAGATSSVCTMTIVVDNIEVAILKPAERVDVYVSSGNHVIEVYTTGWLCPTASATTLFAIGPGEVKAFRAGYPKGNAFSSDSLALMPILP